MQTTYVFSGKIFRKLKELSNSIEIEDCGSICRNQPSFRKKRLVGTPKARDNGRLMVLRFFNVLCQEDLSLSVYTQCGWRDSPLTKFINEYGFGSSIEFTRNNTEAIWTEMKWFVYRSLQNDFGVHDPQAMVFEALDLRSDADFLRRKFGAFLDFSIKDLAEDLMVWDEYLNSLEDDRKSP